jgi:hypothetical protein
MAEQTAERPTKRRSRVRRWVIGAVFALLLVAYLNGPIFVAWGVNNHPATFGPVAERTGFMWEPIRWYVRADLPLSREYLALEAWCSRPGEMTWTEA